MDTDLAVFDLLRFLALRCTEWQPAAKETVEVLRKLLSNIAAEPEDKTRRRVRLANAKVKRAVVDAPGAVDFLIRQCGFRREHLVADATATSPAMNEMVLTCFAEDTSRFHALEGALDQLVLDEVHFTEAVKVQLPNGTELKGAFSAYETVSEVKSWIARCRDDSQRGLWPELGAAWDPTRVFADDETVADANLHKNKLLVRLTGDHGDEARALMEQAEAKRRADAAVMREQQVAKARFSAASKFAKRAEQAQLREKNVLRFKEDRDEAEQRARRVVAAHAAAATVASATDTPLLARALDSAPPVHKLDDGSGKNNDKTE